MKHQKLLNWEIGRQGSGYLKLKLLESKWFKFDLYLLKYPIGSYINWHTDPSIKGYKHWRLNLILKNSKGGKFQSLIDCSDGDGMYNGYQIEDMIHIQTKFLNLFRPDITQHRVTKVISGTRYVLSLGWLTKVKTES